MIDGHPRPGRERGAGRVSLLTDLDAFFTDHRDRGELDAGVEGPIVWFACECGVSMARRADEDDRA